MLANPGFVKPQPVEPLHQLQVALDARAGFSFIGWNGGKKAP